MPRCRVAVGGVLISPTNPDGVWTDRQGGVIQSHGGELGLRLGRFARGVSIAGIAAFKFWPHDCVFERKMPLN